MGADRDRAGTDIHLPHDYEGSYCEADGERRSAPYLTFPRKRGKELIPACVAFWFARGINPFPQFPLSQPALRSRNPSGLDPILGSQFIYCFR